MGFWPRGTAKVNGFGLQNKNFKKLDFSKFLNIFEIINQNKRLSKQTLR